MKHFNEILTTLGAREVDILKESASWDMWRALYRTPISDNEGFYLYLKQKCPLKEATPQNLKLWRNLSKGKGYELVLTPSSSLSENILQTQDAFRAFLAKTTKQLLLDNFLKDFTWRQVVGEEYFIDPDLELSDKSTTHDATRYMLDWLKDKPRKNSAASIAVLTANGGVGKTTLSGVLCDKLYHQDPNIIPILIKSDQWQHLLQSPFTMDTIWDLAISTRFEHAGRLLANKTALRVLVREGLFVVIFDGFDELCVSPGSILYPKEILDNLIELVTPEDEAIQARILLTARETFWESIDDDIDTACLDVFRIKGFDNDKRKRYFRKRLEDQAERDLAFRISKQISGGIYGALDHEELNEDRPSGVPFILDLIAYYVHDYPDANTNPYKTDPFSKLLEDVCRRENKRQKLGIDPHKQFEFFEELFREFPETVSLDDLRLYLEVICSVTDSSVVSRFTNHVFLIPAGRDLFSPRYEVLRVYFLARFLALNLVDVKASTNRGRIVKVLAENRTGKTQVLDWLLRQLHELDEVKLVAAMHHAIEIIRDDNHRESRKDSGMALFHLAQRLVTGSDKSERTSRLSQMLSISHPEGTTTFFETTITGQLRSYDFTSTHFSQCHFVDVIFKNCLFSDATSFLNCTFEGILQFTTCDNPGDIKITSATCSHEAEYTLADIQKIGAREEIRRSFAEDTLDRALKKFKGDYGFMSIQYRHKRTGFRPGNPYNEKVWDVLEEQNIIERHRISNVDEGGLNIRDEKELRKETTSFFDNGVMGRYLSNVIQSLIEK